MNDCNSLVEQIVEESKVLVIHVEVYGLNHQDTIMQSQKLDKLILKYQQQIREGGNC